MPQTGKRGRILVVEDDPILSGIYRSALGMGEFSVECAADGLDALEKIEASRPGLIILDIALPIIDGWAVLERLRSMPDCPPVVVVSSAADLERAKRLGAVACFSKPFRFAQLRATCHEILDLGAAPAGAAGPVLASATA
jgi:DNA-binding response OmpR family regulator